MKLKLIVIFICIKACLLEDDPKTDVELLPEAIEIERRQILLFWAIMFEVCKTFCVWKNFCDKFCQFLNMSKDKIKEEDTSHQLLSLENIKQRSWLYDTTMKVCENDVRCVDNCMKMKFDNEDESWYTEGNTENMFQVLFEIAKKYFTKCAEINSKPLTNVNIMTIDDFCQEITLCRLTNF